MRTRSLVLPAARLPMPRDLTGAAGLPDFGDSLLQVMPVSEALAAPFLKG